jgi:hypothetical protein
MGDGAVKFLLDTIDSNVYRHLSTIADNEIVGEF